ncbi:MAG: DNA gyrase subunit A [Patescibacteria group bacterium]|nr:DNA gyrase subunit A [Patescibacteria group bacterium]MDD5715533.1 DNA gyrase subunit A [Patescibacteria group bacterium]
MPKTKNDGKKQPAPAQTKNQPIIGVIAQQPIISEMQDSYLDYAMSVIISRALPDARDGMKPVHRRILYAMWSIGLRSGAKFRKSATVVGEVLGKYHPHGDSAVYDAMVRMAQDFSMRYMLVSGQGNFGSVDGDEAAAMRYTEAKLSRIAEELLVDIEKNTINFIPNYDGSQKEPQTLPAKLPNLLLNGTMGIAVGMATSIPPHNLSEIIDGTMLLIDNPEATVADLMQHVKGPDFPTGGIIYNKKDIEQAYGTGKGSIVMRGRAEIVEEKTGYFRIIVTEIPYQVNKSTLIAHIASLVQDKRIDGIKDLRDESDKDGVRIVIELKKDAYPKKVLNRLYSLTDLQTSFHVNMLALVDGIQPRVLNLKMVLEEYIKHRLDVVRRRTQYDLDRAKERAHILEGLKKAVDKIDAVIRVIKGSKDKEQAKVNLMKRFGFTERQAIAILEMKLSQLANLERLKIQAELKEKLALIKELEAILGSKKRIFSVIKKELQDLKQQFGDERKTEVNPGAIGEFTQEDLIPNEATVIMITHDGYIKRVAPETFRTQKRGGRGVIGLTTKEQDAVDQLITTTTHADLLFFTSKGRVFQLKAYDVPSASRTAKGQAIVNFLQLAPNEGISSVMSFEELGDFKYLVMVTQNGVIKKVDIKDFETVRRSGLIAVKLRKDDMLEWVKPSTGKDDIILVTVKGQSIRFKEKQVRAMGRNAAGVRAIRLKSGDKVAGMDMINDGKVEQNEQLLVAMENGYGKRTPLRNYRIQSRGGTGVKTAKITPKTGQVVASFIVNAKLEQEDLVIISNKGQVIRLPLKSVSVLGRATQGVRLMRFSETNDKVASVTFV